MLRRWVTSTGELQLIPVFSESALTGDFVIKPSSYSDHKTHKMKENNDNQKINLSKLCCCWRWSGLVVTRSVSTGMGNRLRVYHLST